MNSLELKKVIAESVLNFLNDANHWHDIHGIFNFVDELPDKVKIDAKAGEEQFEVPIKTGQSNKTEKPLFDRGSGKTPNTFKLNKKEN